MDVASIITEFGAYYLNEGQNAQRIVRQLRQPSATEAVFTTVVTNDTRWRAAESRIGRLLQPFQKAFTPIGDVEFVPVEIDQFKLKMDHQEYPDDLEATWLGFLASNNLDRKTWPFVRWLIESELLPRMKEDYELNELYGGVAAAPTPGTAGGVGTAMNGIKKIINDHITATRITPIATGAPSATPATWVGQLEDFADAINTKYWMQSMDLCMSPELKRRYERGTRELYGTHNDFTGENKEIKLSNLNIVPLPSLIGSTKIWATPKNNAIRLLKKGENMNRVQLENVDRQVKIYTDFYTGLGFVIPEIVFTNDQDLV